MPEDFKRKAMTAEQIRSKFIVTLDIQHPQAGLLSFKINRQLGTSVALECGIPVPNALIALVNDPDRKIPADKLRPAKPEDEMNNLSLIEVLRRVAKRVMVEPKYEEIEDIVENDLFILSAISRESTGMNLFPEVFEKVLGGRKPGEPESPFRQADAGNAEAEPTAPRIHI